VTFVNYGGMDLLGANNQALSTISYAQQQYTILFNPY